MERRLDFTINEAYSGIQDYFNKIKSEYNMKVIVILDPAISIEDETGSDEDSWFDVNGVPYPTFSRGIDSDAFIRGSDGELEIGKVWPFKPGVTEEQIIQDGSGWDEKIKEIHAKAAFPDYFNPSTSEWWAQEIELFYNGTFNGTVGQKGLHFDGLWIDMNEPASFVAGRPGPDDGNQWSNGCHQDRGPY